jgi:GNAT superfamily N-acetyltransferase
MNFVFEEITNENFHYFTKLFEDTFGKKIENNNLDLSKKYSYNYLKISKLGFLAFDIRGNVVGGLGVFPVLIYSNNEICLGAQIGDAMVSEGYRNQNLFTQLINKTIEQARKHNVKCLFTFKNINNYGSYKGFLKTNFKEQGTFYCYKAEFKPSIKSRLIRKVSLNIFYKHQNKILYKKRTSYKNVVQKSKKLSVLRSYDYINYKTFKSNHFIEIRSGFVWLSIGEFSIGLGDYVVKSNFNINDLINDLISFSKRIGKDNMLFFTNSNEECEIFDRIKSFKKNNSIKIMKFSEDNKILNENLLFNYADIDTF